MLLALDTATDAITVALHDGESVISEQTVVDRLRHGELLAPTIADVLAAAGIAPGRVTQIAVGVGPGPYTGLRIGIVTAATMAAALGVPVVGVCTLDVIAADVAVPGPFLVATDARRKEVYSAAYDGPLSRVGQPAVGPPADVATTLPVAGVGARLYPEQLPDAVAPEWPAAATLARLVARGEVDLLPTVPLYLRRPDATVPTGHKRVTPPGARSAR